MFLYHLLIETDIPLGILDFVELKEIAGLQAVKDWRKGAIMIHKALYIPECTLSGIIHLYRTADPVPVADGLYDGVPSLQELESRGSCVSILAVPLSVTPQDFLQLMGGHRLHTSHLLVLMDAVVNRYMILIKFHTPVLAFSFWEAFNGRPFNSFEPELCHVVYIKSILLAYDPETAVDLSRPTISIPTGFSPLTIQLPSTLPETGVVVEPSRDSFDFSAVIELPTCPVCLDRMDASATGLLTTLCRHTFHCNCIIKWNDSTCPVCRYSSFAQNADLSLPVNTCVDCNSRDNLWICLICGNVACGRYVSKHAHDHSKQTNHIYALELETQRVWDYVGDSYVHRLIQNSEDGKLVQLPDPSTSTRPQGLDIHADSSLVTYQDTLVAEKLENLGSDYELVLFSQLTTQRQFYENQLSKVENVSSENIARLITENEILAQRVTESQVKASTLLRNQDQQEREQKKKTAKLAELASKYQNQINEEKSLNKNLVQNQEFLTLQITQKEQTLDAQNQRIVDLEDQIRDLMFFLDTQQKVESNAELNGATLVGISPPETVVEQRPKLRKSGKRK